MSLRSLRNPDAVRRRLERVRDVFGVKTRVEMSKLLKIKLITYDAAERTGDLSLGIALLLVQQFPGLTLDWLFRGSPTGVAYDLLIRLRDEKNKNKN